MPNPRKAIRLRKAMQKAVRTCPVCRGEKKITDKDSWGKSRKRNCTYCLGTGKVVGR
jgi:DnaJ-class molecular chaperone